MSNTPSLLGCPFCGGMATAKPIDSVRGWHHVTVLHSDCFYKPAPDKMLLNDEHLAAWNRRTPQTVVREPQWIDPNDKTQRQYLPHIGEPVLFCHKGKTYYGKHTGGNFVSGAGFAQKHFNTWQCRWMYPPVAHGIKGGQHGAE